MSNLVAVITIRYKTHILVYALAATAATVFVCILLACSSVSMEETIEQLRIRVDIPLLNSSGIKIKKI